MSEYRWVPDLVCHGVCPRDGNLHALEVPSDRIIVFTAATCPHCRAERAESALTEAEERHRKEYCQVMSENIGHRQRIAELERDLLGVRKKLGEAKEVACSLLEHVTKWKDHACRECVGDGNLAIDGFQCAYHRALTFCPTAARAAGKEER